MAKDKEQSEEMEPALKNDIAEQNEAAEPESDERIPDSTLETMEVLKKERDEIHDLWLRKHAEFENYRKRVDREKEEFRVRAQGDVIRGMLGVLDAFEKGLEALSQESDESGLKTYQDAYELMLKEFRSVLEKFGLTAVPGQGHLFDPNVHEAVLSEMSADHEDGEILDEFRKGYKLKDLLLRPAQVKVAVQADTLSVAEEEREG